MKKLIALLLAMLMAFVAIPRALGEAAEDAAEEEATVQESESKVEQIMLKKGSAIIKQFITCKEVDVGSTTVTFQTAEITDVETGVKYYGIRVQYGYYASKYDSGTATALIDSEEIDSIISTLEYVKEHKSEFVNYTEVNYTANGGFSIGAYKNSSETGIFLKASGKQRLIKISYLNDIINGLKEAQSKIPN